MIASHVEDELRGICLMGRMTIDAHAWHLGILKDGVLIERGEIALIQSHVTEHLIAWGDASIGQSPLLKGIGTNSNAEVLILFPLSVFPDTDSKGQFSAFVLLRQGVPLVDIEIGKVALHMNLATF